MSHNIKIKVQALVEYTGKLLERERLMRVQRHREGFMAADLYLFNGKLTTGNCWYTVSRLRDLRVEFQREIDGWAASASKSALQADEAKARAEAAQPALNKILATFDYHPGEWETEVWTLVAEKMGQELPDYIGSADGMRLRKLLRPAMTEAKAEAREQYPEDYREEEDKEDFYASQVDDIADTIVGWLV